MGKRIMAKDLKKLRSGMTIWLVTSVGSVRKVELSGKKSHGLDTLIFNDQFVKIGEKTFRASGPRLYWRRQDAKAYGDSWSRRCRVLFMTMMETFREKESDGFDIFACAMRAKSIKEKGI